MRTGNTVAPYSWIPGPNDENGAPGETDHLQRPHDAADVGGLDAGRGVGVDLGQLGVEASAPPGAAAASSSLGPQRTVLGREGHRVDDGLHVQAGAAHEQGPAPARLDVGDRGAGFGLEAHHRPLLVGVAHVDEVMRDAGPLGGRGLGGADVHAAVHLHRVHRDDLDVVERLGDLQREPRLARRGGTDEREVFGQAGAATTGMRSRAGCRDEMRGGRTASRSPRRKCGAAEVTSTSASPPIATLASPGRKCTSLP